MSFRRHALLIAAALPVLGSAACSGPAPTPAANNEAKAADVPAMENIVNAATPAAAETAAAPAQETLSEASYTGRWKGVEGMVLDVKAKPGGGVAITNQWDLDHKGEFAGNVTDEGLRWVRGGETVTARPSDGDATGLKYLAGKKDCLTVKSGEGYCRD